MVERTVPVYLLTGFLGSGKTTLLRRLIDDANGRGWKPAVLMNEAGDVNLDGMLVGTEVPMAEMLGGCICCTVRADLGVELMSLVKEHDPDVIWIESTGVAEPLEIIDGVTEASFYGRIELKGVVTVVDARHLLDRMRIGTGKTYRLMQDQIRAASLVVLNKTDLVAPAERDELAERLADWNAGAAIVQTVGAELDPERIYGIHEGLPAQTADQEHRHEHHHEHHHGHHHVRAMTRYLKGPVDSHAFEAFVGRLPEGVYRAKGIVSFRDTANRYLFQYAYRQSDFLPIRPQKTVHDVLVFIGEDFSESDLDAELDKLTAEDRN
ncbi:CobW family GTP-binding protein [Cohnella candidum]|uniref:GTP-binding protein n=1 Tax=Cohnella candidum TaxID=2674991 RepID=A0A3G3JWB6_9BACL|nr:GTP-binding protein [Cohnella candidum]AYQ72543.1 GTP-binding protein [Cohnella candidum]